MCLSELPGLSGAPVLSSTRSSARRAAEIIALGTCLLSGGLTSPVDASASGGILYVAKNNPTCSDVGSGTASQPFCSIKPAAATAKAGDTVQVEAGTYTEAVTVSSSGTAEAPITFTAAPGATPRVTGAGNGFYIVGLAYVTVEGFDVTGTSGDGIVAKGSDHITLRANHVSYAGQPVSGSTAKGIRLDGTNDSVVDANTVDHNTDYGIYLLGGSTRDQVSANRVFANARGYTRAAAGIHLFSAPGNVVSANIAYRNEDSGIDSYTGSGDESITGNVTYLNGDHGIDNYSSSGQRIVSNTVYANVTAGINLEAGSSGASLANNLSVDNGIDSPRAKGNIRVDSTSTAGTTIDHDLVNLRVSQTMFQWGDGFYYSLAALRSATSQEAHGIQADPLWSDPAAGDFHLRSGSPAIDSANSGASGELDADIEGTPRWDDPASPNTGTGLRTYDDRGAYEHYVQGPASETPTGNEFLHPIGESTGYDPDASLRRPKPTRGPAVRISPSRVHLTRRGTAVLSVACPKIARHQCRGRLRLIRRGRSLGSSRFALASATSTDVVIRLPRTIRASIGRRPLRVTAIAIARDSASPAPAISKRAVWLVRTAR